MSEPVGPWELRSKCTETMHREFYTFAMALGKEGAEVLRELVADWLEQERHAHTMRCRLLRSEGIDVETAGSAS